MYSIIQKLNENIFNSEGGLNSQQQNILLKLADGKIDTFTSDPQTQSIIKALSTMGLYDDVMDELTVNGLQVVNIIRDRNKRGTNL